MARNKDFFVNNLSKRDRSFFVKEEKPVNTSKEITQVIEQPTRDNTKQEIQSSDIADKTSEVVEGAKLVNESKSLMNMQQKRLMNGATNLSEYAKTLSPEKIEEIKSTSAILHPELLEKKDPDAKYYFGKFALGTSEAVENLADATVALSSNLGIGKAKALEKITSIGGLAPNSLSERFKDTSDRFKKIKENAYSTDLIPVKEVSQILANEYEPNKVEALAGDVLSGIGGMLPTIATDLLVPGAGYGVLGMQSAGGGTKQAYENTRNLGVKEEIYGLLSGLAEVGVEKLSGGIGGLGDGAIDDIASKLIKNGFIRSATGEGIEEAVTTLIDPYLQRLTYDKAAEGGITNAETWKEATRSAIIGSLTSMVLQGGSAAINLPQTVQQSRAEIRNSLEGLDQMLPNYENVSETASTEKNVTSELPTMASQQAMLPANQTEGKTAQNGNIGQIEKNVENNDALTYNNGRGGINEGNKLGRMLERMDEPSRIYEENKSSQAQKYTRAEYKQFEKSIRPIGEERISNTERELIQHYKNKYNKDVVLFDEKENQGYIGGASLTDRNKIYIDINSANEFGYNMVASHEVMESDILYNSELKEDLIKPIISKIINDPNFEQQKMEFWSGQDGNMPSDYLIAKDIICDRFAELDNNEALSYKNVLSQETNMTLDYGISNFREAINKNLQADEQSAFSMPENTSKVKNVYNINEDISYFKSSESNMPYMNLNENISMNKASKHNKVGLSQIEEQQGQPIDYSPVNSKQRLEMRNIASDSNGRVQILPTQKVQETVRSAKLAGMTDVDVKRATELNNAINSGAKLMFYDPNNIPAILQGQNIDKAKIANGFYKDGTIWINKNSSKVVETILGHELTHHIENIDIYNGMSEYIKNSNTFYEYISEKGYNNISEYQTELKKLGYGDSELNAEIIANFCEEKLFASQETINNLARNDTKLFNKIKNWISDLVVKFKGTTVEKEIRKIENMYRKALDQARNNFNSNTTDIKYNIKNIAEFDQTEYNNIKEMKLSSKEYGKLAHIVDTDPTIKPGKNYVETSDATYIIYQKEYNDFKVVDKYEGGVNNDTIASRNIQRIDETRNAREGFQDTSENTRNEGTTKSNDELLDGNKGARSVKIQSDRNGINNKQNVAGKEPAFSMPEIPEGYTRLYRGLAEEFNQNYDRSKLDNVNGYESWTDSYELAKAYGDNVYYIDIPTSEIKNTIIDNDSSSETYGDRNLIYFNDKPVGIKEKSGNEYMLYTDHDNYSDIEYKKVENSNKSSFSLSETNKLSNENIRYSIQDDIDKLNEEYGSIKSGEKPVNDVKIPKRTGKDKYVSQYARTMAEAGVTTNEALNLLEKDVVEGRLSHEVITDKQALNWAENFIKENGWEDSVNTWDSWIKGNKSLDKDQLALGQMIYNNAVQNKDSVRVTKMIGDLVAEFSESGRNLQAARLLKKMTPDGRLYSLERSVAKINQELSKQFADFAEGKKITIPDELAKKMLDCQTIEETNKVVAEIQQHIADQVPPTWHDKFNAWRYLAMLGNSRTHIRNIVGNAFMIPAKNLKNEIGTVLEKTLPKEQRTKAVLNPFSETDNMLKDFSANDFDQNAEMVRGESKYDIRAGIKEKQRIFSTEPLERLRKANFNALEAEDAFFLKKHYVEAFAEAMKARGITVNDARSNSQGMNQKLSEIREIATNEAQKATYRDFNALAQAISKAKSGAKSKSQMSKTFGGKVGWGATNLALEGIVPFAKTPANIVRRGIEYSPFGLASGIYDACVNVKKGNITAAQAIDKISSGLSGTTIVGLGMLLSNLGIVSGGEKEENKEQNFDEMIGMQNYALNVGKYNYTIDWSAPASMPLFVGVELWNALQKENVDLEDAIGALSRITEPVFELSMLQGIESTIKTAAYSDHPATSIATNAGKSYISQYNPTLFGQIARTIDDTRRVTYEDKNKSFSSLRKFGQQQLQKVPFANKTLLPKYDQFGRKDVDSNVLLRAFENFISPGYISEDKSTPVENELSRVYKQTGSKEVLPSYAAKYVTVDGKRIDFSQEQYEEYTVERGQKAYNELKSMFEDKQYLSLSDEDKRDIIKDIYDYSTELAKTKVTDCKMKETSRNGKIYKAEQQGISAYKYLLVLQNADLDGNGYLTQDEFNSALQKSNLSLSEKTYLKELNSTNKSNTKTSNTKLPTLAEKRAKLPTLKK